MSWLELDDQILEHPKFIRAVKVGGSEAIHMWLGLRAYCGQKLSDGEIPNDMVDEARGPKEGKKRASAIAALIEVGLVEKTANGLKLHDYLDWSSSREEVEERRLATAERQRKRRENGANVTRDKHRDSRVTHADVTPLVTPTTPLPSDPLPSSPLRSQPIGSETDPLASLELPAPRGRKTQETCAPDFLRFWEQYPRKTGKGAAAASWKRLTPEINAVLSTLGWQSKSFDWTKENGKYVPLPATYLNQRRWEDEPTRPSKPIARPIREGPPLTVDFAAHTRQLEENAERERAAAADRFKREREAAEGTT